MANEVPVLTPSNQHDVGSAFYTVSLTAAKPTRCLSLCSAFVAMVDCKGKNGGRNYSGGEMRRALGSFSHHEQMA